MASVQARREMVRDEGGILVEKDRVPKITTHFESLAGKGREDQGESESERKRREAGFLGKVGAGVKDEAAVVGWGTTQYTLEMAAQATKAVADMTSSVAGYTGEKAVAAKDKVGSAGMTVVRYAGEKVAATTNAVVAAEEKAAEYAARKQEEARRALHSHEIVEESKEQREASEVFVEEEEEEEEEGSSILGAIGETIVEIGETAKSFLLGLYPIQHKDEANSGRKIN